MDSYYRGLVDNPDHYDRMIVLLQEYNPGAIPTERDAETFIHECIRKALRDGDCAVGCCMAMRTRQGDKVRLFLEPLIPEEDRKSLLKSLMAAVKLWVPEWKLRLHRIGEGVNADAPGA